MTVKTVLSLHPEMEAISIVIHSNTLRLIRNVPKETVSFQTKQRNLYKGIYSFQSTLKDFKEE